MTSDKKKPQKNPQLPLTQQQISNKRVWAFRLISIIILPLILFSCLEAGLRLAGFGYSTDIAIKQKVGGTVRYCYNMKLGWRFLPKRLARDLVGFAFDVKKSPQTYRIFVLGASAAQGVPDEHYNFGRFIEIMLEHEYPQTDFEVINVAMTAVNSHAVYQIAKSCANFEPDLMIVYLGNNEVVGPYGAGTIFTPLAPSLAMIRAYAAITSTRTGQLLQSLLYAFGANSKVAQSWGGMEMFLDEQVRPEADALGIVYSHFEQNLRDICNVGIQAGANVIVSNVGCNLKDSAPFASQHRDGMTDSEMQAWEKDYQQGIVYETAGELDRAIEKYLAAEQIDNTFADMQFRLGRCYWRLGQYQKAKQRYLQAREYDTLRFRVDATINKVIQSVSQGRTSKGVYFVDAVGAMEENSPHETPGNELFYEHVHYRFEGNYILAKTIFEQVKKTLPEGIKKHKKDLPALTLAECENRLVYTALERYLNGRYVLELLISKPPFTNQSYHDGLVAELENETARLKQDIQSSLEKIPNRYNEQITRHPHDWRLRWKLGNFFYRNPAQYEQAVAEFKKILCFLPYDRAYERLVSIRIRQNNLDEAEHYCRELIKVRPASADSYFNLGDVFRIKADYDQAIHYFSKGIRLQPTKESIYVYGYLAEVFEKKGDPEKAIETLYEAIENSPKEQTAMAHINLGLLLGRYNKPQEAIRILRTAINDFPPGELKNENEVFGLLLELDQIELALKLCRQILKVQPNSIFMLNNLAWIQAACNDEKIRNAKEAVEFAKKACVLTDYRSAGALDTLAVAYAAAGNFRLAATTAEKAMALAIQDDNMEFAQRIQNRLRLYQSGKKFFDPQLK